LKVKKLKVGHAGTLDPLATGLLLVCTGKATKQVESLQAQEKEYIATLRLGATTPSFDCETKEDQWFPTDHINIDLFSEKLREFHGPLEQVPPSFSAVKINGKRAYKHARAGRDPELKPKTIVITHIKLLSFNMPEAIISITCSKGTYIRALARDIGNVLGSGAYLTALRRTRIGDFYVDNALSFDTFREKFKTEIEN
jgi:tRNA pseudouridine55 synthase